MGRNDLCFCGSGLKQKKCHKGINEKSKWAAIYKANKAFDEAVEVSQRGSLCPTTCSICCDALFPVSEEDFLFIIDYLCHGDLDLLDEKIASAWIISDHIQKHFPKYWQELSGEMETTYDWHNIERKYFGNDFQLSASLPRCMFLSREGRCEIYEQRPQVCRSFGTDYPCSISQNKVTEEGIESSSNLSGVHNSIGSNTRQRLVKRPYPLFYWFTYFLEDDFSRRVILKNLSMFKSTSEDAYFRKHKF